MNSQHLQKEKMRSFFSSFFLLFPTASVAFFKMLPIPYHTMSHIHSPLRVSGIMNHNNVNDTCLNETTVIADGRAFGEWMRLK